MEENGIRKNERVQKVKKRREAEGTEIRKNKEWETDRHHEGWARKGKNNIKEMEEKRIRENDTGVQ